MRELARRLGVRAPSLYFHVRSREEILDALVDLGLAELGENTAAVLPPDDPSAALHRLADAYCGFAFANPRLFALTFGPCPPRGEPDLDSGARSYAALIGAVEALHPAEDVLDLAQAFWSLVHGYATLALAGRFWLGGDPARALHLAIDLLVRAITSERGKEVGRTLSSTRD